MTTMGMSTTPHTANQLLELAGMRQTPQRLVILRHLLACTEHPSAEDLHARIAVEFPSISIGTIYRTLESLVEVGIVRRVRSEAGTMFFDANPDPHHHLFDTQAGKFADYDAPELDRLIADYLHRHPIPGFSVQDFQLHINGTFQNSSH
jgi:Fur family peroxide stress response transcriptional regulator